LFFTIIRLKQREEITFNIFVLIPMRIYFLCFLVNLIHAYIESSKIQFFFFFF